MKPIPEEEDVPKLYVHGTKFDNAEVIFEGKRTRFFKQKLITDKETNILCPG